MVPDNVDVLQVAVHVVDFEAIAPLDHISRSEHSFPRLFASFLSVISKMSGFTLHSILAVLGHPLGDVPPDFFVNFWTKRRPEILNFYPTLNPKTLSPLTNLNI